VIYPQEYLHQVQAAVAVVVLSSWIGALILWRRRRRRASTATDPTEDTRPGDTGLGGGAATV
jgi:hypothetical protein